MKDETFSSVVYPIAELRERFEIAVDVKDNALNKAFFEADMLDLKPQIGMGYDVLPTEYKNGSNDVVGGTTILCYYAFARYSQAADQSSTSTGLKLQTYGGSVVLPDTSKTKRAEAERAKADFMVEGLIAWLRQDGLLACPKIRNTRISLIK